MSIRNGLATAPLTCRDRVTTRLGDAARLMAEASALLADGASADAAVVEQAQTCMQAAERCVLHALDRTAAPHDVALQYIGEDYEDGGGLKWVSVFLLVGVVVAALIMLAQSDTRVWFTW